MPYRICRKSPLCLAKIREVTKAECIYLCKKQKTEKPDNEKAKTSGAGYR